ncbi:type VI secretion system-associated protein TagF [Mesorhizobium sp. B2-2-4]|uniref:type VI secretion system-associated protein TagF n=1 Tax=unclassified Mesorhizobium TaxID=325217 RepID=UPI00112EF56F|nr:MULTISPECIES: type VI secretion system-associated protein TagF [unclassified Mesorhizobium]TPM52254.1 type VI secretion system-associated protein TagF [Mesorhizobium sp. B2-2-4]TPM61433.1 type VI secretion system-associated protein TagF [Mesorhizobium sp. B2-2-1]TPN64516.1 type VI secretion system-associated protein TagF [Mesorhizobium sp. B1-1-3]
MSRADMNAPGFYGKIPATGDFVAWNLPRTFIDRWDRWMSMELLARPDEGELDSRVWRFTMQPGIFGDLPCAGAWRMSEDRVGRRYPFAIVRLGPPPEPTARWFDEIAACLNGAVEGNWSTTKLAETLALLRETSTGDASAITFWCDDFDVIEFSFADIHDLADNALPKLRATKPTIEDI